MDTRRTGIFERRIGEAYAFTIIVFAMLLFGCSMKTENERLKIVRDTIFVRDTIVIRDSFPWKETVFVKNHNHEAAILPVDTILEACMNENPEGRSTAGSVYCFDEASKRLLVKIKKKEDKLMAFLDPEHKALLKKSQQNWRAFLGTEEVFLYKTYYTWANYSSYPSLGSYANLCQGEWKYRIVAARLIALEEYYDLVYYDKKKVSKQLNDN